jgi:5-methylcytosine-specific restriction protein A
MPRSAPHPCSNPRCRALVPRGVRFCPVHLKAHHAAQARRRGENPVRAALDAEYGTSQWRRARAVYLAENPLCVLCERQGHVAPATVLDHIVPTADGGSFWDSRNWQGLCDPCHRTKSARETFGRG